MQNSRPSARRPFKTVDLLQKSRSSAGQPSAVDLRSVDLPAVDVTTGSPYKEYMRLEKIAQPWAVAGTAFKKLDYV